MRHARAIALVAAAIVGQTGLPASAQDSRPGWRVEHVDTPAPVAGIRQAADGSVLFTAGGQWYRLSLCGGHICRTRSQAPRVDPPPAGGLADGGLATDAGDGIARAWYAEPTGRYDHGILGDGIEAGALVVEDGAGLRRLHRLPETTVFEDLTPRLADLDGDGRAEAITIATRIDRGAFVAVFAAEQGQLRRLAATPPIGRTHRWLNIAGIADFDGDGARDIAIVTTPHIGGTLQIWSYRNGRLELTASLEGFSNHAIGSRNLGLSAVADADGDGLADLIVPDARRRSLRMVGMRAGVLQPIAGVALPGAMAQNLGVLRAPAGPVFLVGLEDGSLVAVTRP